MSAAARAVSEARRSGAIIPAGWALMNAVWLWVDSGFDAVRPTGVGTTWPLYLSSSAVAITMLLAGCAMVSGWRHPADRRVLEVSRRGDMGIYAALGMMFTGLTVIYGLWWLPFAIVSVVLALFILVRDARIRARLRG